MIGVLTKTKQCFLFVHKFHPGFLGLLIPKHDISVVTCLHVAPTVALEILDLWIKHLPKDRRIGSKAMTAMSSPL